MKPKQLRLEGLVVVLISVGLFGIWHLWLMEPAIAEENRLLELGQVIFLAGAALVCFIRMTAGEMTKRLFPFGFLFLFFLTFLLREVDVEDFPLPDIVVLLGSGPGRDILLAAAWIVYLFLLVRRPVRLPEIWYGFLTSRLGIYFTAGIFCYLAAMPFDKNMLDLSQSALLFGEEGLELTGTFLLFLATFWKGKRKTLHAAEVVP